MNKVIAINLNGNAYQLEECGYEALRAYLDGAGRRLEGNPDRDEIIADIEQAIADKCRTLLGTHKSVVSAKEIGQIIEEMGPVEDASAEAEPSAAPGSGSAARAEDPAAESKEAGPFRRCYKIPEGWVTAGVCNGLAAHFNVDVTLVRIAFILLSLLWGVGIILYLALAIILPTATTPAEKAAAQGPPPTAQDFIRRAKEGYYEGMKTFADKHAHREWRRRFRQEMRGWRRTFKSEMREHARSWQPAGAPGWAPGCPPGIGAWFALPFALVVRKALALLWIFALISLLATGAVFGLPLPGGMPVWAGALCLIVLYHFLAWPFKAMRRAYYWNCGGPFYAPPYIHALDALVGLVFVVLLFWFAAHHLSEIREAIRHVPAVGREAVDTVSSWWTQK